MGYVMPIIIPMPEYPIIASKQSIAWTPSLDAQRLVIIVPDPNKDPNNVVQLKYTGK